MKTTGKANNFLDRIRTSEPLENNDKNVGRAKTKVHKNKTNRQIGTNSKEINPSATKISREDNDTSKVTNRFQQIDSQNEEHLQNQMVHHIDSHNTKVQQQQCWPG